MSTAHGHFRRSRRTHITTLAGSSSNMSGNCDLMNPLVHIPERTKMHGMFDYMHDMPSNACSSLSNAMRRPCRT